jgi:methyl-accepting chemotaxis protein
LSGQEGQAIFDSLGGHVVLSSYAPVDIMGARWAIMAEMDKDDALSAVAVLKLSVSIIAAISIALIAALALFVSKSFTRPIIYAVSVAERIAANDLSTPITNARGDEIGQLLTALGHVVRELNGTLSKVTSSTSELAAASAQLSGTAKETSDAVSQQKRQMDQVVSAITELTASSEVVATNSTNTANAAAQADQEAKHGKALVAKVQDSIKSLSSGVEKATSANEELAQDSQDIGRILDVIRGIAEQTNLLALNAAIEAARAGDLGRGFAVVADEVRVLAQRSQEATEEIQAMISRLQTRSQHVVDLMCKGREEARESVELASTAFSSLDAILSSIEVIKEMSYQIATAAEEQTAVTAEINRNVDEISRMSDVTLSGADKESAASAALEQLAESLNNQVKVFKLESA